MSKLEDFAPELSITDHQALDWYEKALKKLEQHPACCKNQAERSEMTKHLLLSQSACIKKCLSRNKITADEKERQVRSFMNQTDRYLENPRKRHRRARKNTTRGHETGETNKPACASCNTSNAEYKCSRCRRVFYCSRDCQRRHWPEHKTVCRAPQQ